jgi:glycine/D-amino acid oxidase-like deaminating enzyme
MGHDVLVNATGFGAMRLLDVGETKITAIRQQNLRIRKHGYNRLYIRRGAGGYYSTAFARDDGTIYIGGIKSEGDERTKADVEQRKVVSVY